MNFHSRRFDRAAATYGGHAEVQESMADALIGMLPEKAMRTAKGGATPMRVFEMGCGTGIFTRRLRLRFPEADILATDAAPRMLEESRKNLIDRPLATTTAQGIIGVTAWEIFEASGSNPVSAIESSRLGDPIGFDLAASNALVQWFPDLRTHFAMVASALNSGGLYLVSGFTRDNFPELNALLGAAPFGYREFPGHSPDEIKTAAGSAGFRVEAWHEDSLEKVYASTEAFLAMIRGLGSARRPGTAPLTREKLILLAERYQQSYRVPGGVRATWKPWHAMLVKAV